MNIIEKNNVRYQAPMLPDIDYQLIGYDFQFFFGVSERDWQKWITI